MNSPVVSVIIPVYKAEDYLSICVESVLEQTFTDYEIILVNDGSPDRSGEICDEFARRDKRIKVYHIENGGVSHARNYAMDQASGKFYSFLDADDIWMPNYLDEVVRSFNAYANAGLCACARLNIRSAIPVSKVNFDNKSDAEIFIIDNFIRDIKKVITSGITIIAEVYDEVGGFRIGAKRGQDLDMWIRVSAKYQVIYNNKPVFYYREDALFNSTKRLIIGQQFPYWEWYNYSHPYQIALSRFATRLLLLYVRRCIMEKSMRLALFYLKKISLRANFFR